MKASNYSCIPLIRAEHLGYHRIGKKAFEQKYGIDCAALVKRLNDLWWTAKKLGA